MSNQNQALGIDQVLPFSSLLGKGITAVVTVDADQDGTIQLLEIFNKVQAIAIEGYTIYQITDFETLKAQLGDLDTSELIEIVDSVAATFDIPNDDAEALIEDWLTFIFRTIDEVTDLVARTQLMFAVNNPPNTTIDENEIADENA